VRITNQRVVIHYSYFDSLNSGLLTLVGWHVAVCAAYRAITNKPRYSTIRFEAIEIVSVHKKLLFHVIKIRIKSTELREKWFTLAWKPEVQSKITLALKPEDADRLISSIPSFSREGSLGPMPPDPPTSCAPPVPAAESVRPTSFYYRSNGVVVGPLNTYQLRQHAMRGLLKPDALVKKGEDGKWVSASHVIGLFGDTKN
jgi:GYF domain 2